jgi:hypothetical protein
MDAEGRRLNRRAKTVAFKADAELAEFLGRLPNASDFIRKAILAQFRMTCPLCTGTGVVPRGVGEHFAEVVVRFRVRPCETCGSAEPIPVDPHAVPGPDRTRWEQFFHGGPFYCAHCYDSAPEHGGVPDHQPHG